MTKEEQIELIIRKGTQIFNEDSLRKKLNNGQKLYLIFVNDSIFPITFFGNSEHLFTSKLTNLEEIHFKDNSQKIIKF